MESKVVFAAKYCALEAALSFKPAVLRECIAENGSVEKAFETLNKSELSKSLNIFYANAYSIIDSWKSDVQILVREHGDFPSKLSVWANPTEVLYIKGKREYLDSDCVAVVGSRAATDEGRMRAFRLSKILTENEYCVSSGLALGIDASAHIGALRLGGKTIAVIGTPINKYYPKENEQLQDMVAQQGAVISQFSPIRPTQKLNFPQRNELMSAFSLATVIVEASETSGALTQARFCLKQGRKLFIMQNQIEKKELTWPKEYLKKGAHALKSVEDLLQAIESPSVKVETGNSQLKLL